MPIGKRDPGPTNKQIIVMCREAMVQHANGLMSDYQLLCFLWKKSIKAKEHPKQLIVKKGK